MFYLILEETQNKNIFYFLFKHIHPIYIIYNKIYFTKYIMSLKIIKSKVKNSKVKNWNEYKKVLNGLKPKINYRSSKASDIENAINKFVKSNKIIKNVIKKYVKSNKIRLNKFFNEPVNNSKYTSTSKQFINNLKNISINSHYLLELHFTINGIDSYKILSNTDEINNMLERINQGYETIRQDIQGSDTEEILDFIQYGGTVELTWFNRNDYHRTNTAAYFKWFHKLSLDLTKYQVYTKNQKIDYETCLVYALIQAEVDNDKINQLRLNVFEKNVSFRNLGLVSKQLDLQIELTYYDEKLKQKKIRTYNKDSTNIVKLAVVDEHYFINEMTNITSSAITYHDETKNSNYYPMVYLKSLKHKVKKCEKYLTSYEVIRNIYNKKKLRYL
jgi:hypothetical protein